MMRLWAFTLIVLTLSCSDDHPGIQVLFPDQDARDLAARLELLAVDPEPGESCSWARGKTPAVLGERVMATVEVDLRAKQSSSATLPDVPARPLLISALVYKADGSLFLAGCAPVDPGGAGPGEVLVELECPDGSSYPDYHCGDKTPWTKVALETTSQLQDIWGSSDDDIWAVGTAGTILHHDGNAWSEVASKTSQTLRAVWGTGPSNVWAVGDNGTSVVYNGTSWLLRSTGTTRGLHAVWADSTTIAFAAGDNGTILASAVKGSWSTVSSSVTSNSLRGIWGSSPTQIRIVGAGGQVIVLDADGWGVESTGTTQYLYGISGSSASSIWAVGASGTILRLDGSSWSAATSGTSKTLYDVWCHSAEKAWAVGADGTILRYDGNAWVVEPSGATAGLRGVWASDSGQVWAVGGSGLILHRTP